MSRELPSPEAPLSLLGPETLNALVALARQAPPGPFVEVGVYKGGSAWHLGQLALEQGRELWLYDTFAGIPYFGPRDSHKVGDFADTDYAAVQRAIPHAHVVMGIFPESARGSQPHGARYFPGAPVAFCHLDCDQERAYRDALEFLIPRMAKGGFMWFDDAPCLPGALYAVNARFPPERLQLDKGNGKYYVQF